MNDQQLLQLLDKFLRKECSPEETQALESWLERYESPYREAAPPDAAPRLAAVYDSITSRLQAEGEMPGAAPAPVRRLRWWKPAAAAAILIAGATAFYFTTRQPDMLTASAPAGESTFVELPDGSRVWLNARSSLRYPGNMGSSRTVHLSGEGYFEVAPDQQRPFEIRTEELSVQVLGTSFNLKAYEEDAELETTLVDGKVAVSLRNDPSRRQLLAPGQKLLLTRKTTAGATGSDWGDFYAQLQNNTKTKDTIATESLWRKGRLQFRDQSFSELAKTMERWYNKRIVIEDAALNDNRFSGEFRKEDITQALKALQIIANFTYDMREDTVFIQQ